LSLSQRTKISIQTSVNNESNKRACGSKDNVYKALIKMLRFSNPTNARDTLLKIDINHQEKIQLVSR
jgi:hypothetical protein